MSNNTKWHIPANKNKALMLAKRQLLELFCDAIYSQAIFLFLTMARCQFLYDVNKRVGRFMMRPSLKQRLSCH